MESDFHNQVLSFYWTEPYYHVILLNIPLSYTYHSLESSTKFSEKSHIPVLVFVKQQQKFNIKTYHESVKQLVSQSGNQLFDQSVSESSLDTTIHC